METAYNILQLFKFYFIIFDGHTESHRKSLFNGGCLLQWFKDINCLKEGSVLFNDALNTFYLRLYSVGRMVKGHSDSDRGNPLPPLLFPISNK